MVKKGKVMNSGEQGSQKLGNRMMGRGNFRDLKRA